ncbi:MAG TPA: hypothetical protein VEY68_13255 [Anoxybacillus sp.]|jgi:hypothetical protein|nr:hypothetical protein [Anoxybacillus sp.]
MKKSFFFIVGTIFLLFFPINTNGENQTDTPPYKQVAVLPNANIQLLAKEEYGWLRDFQLRVGKRAQNFPEWENLPLSERTRPQLYSLDVTGDGIEEIIVFLIKARGDGLYKNEVHVLQKTNNEEKTPVREIVIEDPRAVVLKNMKLKETKQGVELMIDDIHALIPNNELEKSSQKLHLSVDHFLKYTINHQRLKAILLLERKTGEYLGSLIVVYEYKNGILQGKQIEFVRH